MRRYKDYLFIVGLGFFVYLNGLFGAFVWDDINQIQNNTYIYSISNFFKFFLGGTFSQNNSHLAGLYYRPLMSTVFSLIYSFFGPQVFFFHFFQVSIHILNSLLIFVFLKKFIKKPIAFFSSLVFLIHPINVESVSYISMTQDPLFFLFGIIALLIFQKKTIKTGQMALISFFLFLSILSKETGVLFGILILLYFFTLKKINFFQTFKVLVSVVFPILIYFF